MLYKVIYSSFLSPLFLSIASATAVCTSALPRTLLNTKPSFIPFRSVAVPSRSPRNGANPSCNSCVASTSVVRERLINWPSFCIVCELIRSPCPAAVFLLWSGGVSCEMKMWSMIDACRASLRIWKGRR